MTKTESAEIRWWRLSGAWLGIGASPGSLLMGVIIAPLAGLLLSSLATALWAVKSRHFAFEKTP